MGINASYGKVEKFKNLQNKAFFFALGYCPLGTNYPRAKKQGNHYQSTQDTTNIKEEKVGKLYFANS